MADSTAGGRQVDGFHGISLEYMRSPKFIAADGGYERIVWMPADLKEQLREFIPGDLIEKIATEKDVTTISELVTFLTNASHPVLARWKPEEAVTEKDTRAASPVFSAGEFPFQAGGFKIILKNARIYADKVTIVPIKPKRPGRGE
jgi:acetyl-CoA decarbonylase/synthase complex subunit beta